MFVSKQIDKTSQTSARLPQSVPLTLHHPALPMHIVGVPVLQDPAYVKQHNMTIDLEYYLNNQIKNSVVSLLEPIYPKSEVKFLRPRKCARKTAVTARYACTSTLSLTHSLRQ